MVKVVLVGLGTIGGNVANYLLQRGHQLVAVVDSDPDKVGKPARQISNADSDVLVSASPDQAKGIDAEVAIVTARSRLTEVAEPIESAIAHGMDVVTTCEEASFPWFKNEGLGNKIDRLAKKQGVTVVGVGVNPGFIMDWVPSLIASGSRSVVDISVKRSVDVRRRRKQLQSKVGAGLTMAQFENGLADGTIGHMGLPESISLIAASLGEEIRDLKQEALPVLGDEGYVLGIRQSAEAWAGDCRIGLRLEMTTISSDFDDIEVKGDPPLKVHLDGGVFGDSSTVALTVHAAERVAKARPGFMTVLELPLMTRRDPIEP